MSYNLSYQVPTNKALIDSLTIFIDLYSIEILDYKLVTPYQVFYEEYGEVIDDLNPPKPIYSDNNGIRFRFSIVQWTHPKTQEKEMLCCITITAKMLREHYFEGINQYNYTRIVDYINEQNVVKITNDDFLNARFNDFDLCVNYKLQFEPYLESIKMLKDMVKDSQKHIVELYPAKETQRTDENAGLIFNKREKSTTGKPFIKFYNKTFELLHNSVEFYNTYIFPNLKFGLNIKDIIRKEITIKNAMHKRTLFKQKLIRSVDNLNSVADLFKLSQMELDTICNVQLKKYYDKRSFSVSSDLSPTEIILSNLMFRLVEKGDDKINLLTGLNYIDCPVAKSRMKKKLLEVIDITFNDEYMAQKIEENSISNQFIRMLDLW